MDEIREQQIEALEIGMEYVLKLVPAIKEIIPELRGQQKEDTQDFLNQIVEGINFIIDIINATFSLINEKEEILNRDGIEESVQKLNSAYTKREYAQISDVFETSTLPFLDIFYQVASIRKSQEI